MDMDIMGKMGEMQKRMEDIQNRLERITVIGEAEGGAVKVTMTATRCVVNVEIGEELIKAGDKEHIEDLITSAINRASDQANSVTEAETAAVYRDMLPGMPGLGI